MRRERMIYTPSECTVIFGSSTQWQTSCPNLHSSRGGKTRSSGTTRSHVSIQDILPLGLNETRLFRTWPADIRGSGRLRRAVERPQKTNAETWAIMLPTPDEEWRMADGWRKQARKLLRQPTATRASRSVMQSPGQCCAALRVMLPVTERWACRWAEQIRDGMLVVEYSSRVQTPSGVLVVTGWLRLMVDGMA
ncbi:uncharacterized protein BKA78DRAFT_86611 [Phyllosticta capitalensis]|uniref:uncharacterized protein n=1 Tax=Phyllosticta capitalensis TaxID=121624 RepID=UPI00312F1313